MLLKLPDQHRHPQLFYAPQKSYDTKRAFKSPSWTTRIDQVPIAR
ncbi:hypothetical protein GGR48_002648 [Sphingomonas pseudosanguinis]|jgi:hypothetical protein|uniref:DUF4113 domain-containing protein n=1 Tax=Sphingomonas pseudosanguinis TaxID=413712 RepID=A0A7W6ACH0_9SPHN|nr:hypothetical protein [Sphingomonas pseudosanguinis]